MNNVIQYQDWYTNKLGKHYEGKYYTHAYFLNNIVASVLRNWTITYSSAVKFLFKWQKLAQARPHKAHEVYRWCYAAIGLFFL